MTLPPTDLIPGGVTGPLRVLLQLLVGRGGREDTSNGRAVHGAEQEEEASNSTGSRYMQSSEVVLTSPPLPQVLDTLTELLDALPPLQS